MSPEQCTGETVDARSDLYAVGCTLFETLSGFVPFEAKTAFEIALMHQENMPPLLSSVNDNRLPQSISISISISISTSIDAVIDKCLAKLPRDRYQSAKELTLDLERIKEGKEITHARRSQLEVAGSVETEVAHRRPPWPILAVVAAAVSILFATVFARSIFSPNKLKPVSRTNCRSMEWPPYR